MIVPMYYMVILGESGEKMKRQPLRRKMNILFTNISNKIRLFAYVYYVGFLVTYESTNNGDPRILRIMHLQVSFTSCDLTGYPNIKQR